MNRYAYFIVYVLLIGIATAFTKQEKMSQGIWKASTMAGGKNGNKVKDGTAIQQPVKG